MTKHRQLNNITLTLGFVIGFVIGSILTLVNLKQSGKDTRRQLLNQRTEFKQYLQKQDQVAESIMKGKAAARQRREATPGT